MNINRLTGIGLLILGFALPLRPAPQTAGSEKKTAFPVFSYNQENRRDPFKDLFGGKEVREKRIITGLADLEIEEVVVIGIVKSQGRFEALASFSDGFPITFRDGQKLADGYVLSIEEDKITYRKTSDKGFPLSKPKDIIKEITPEERTHD
jgi:Tfp pilus assembly protein PilP